MLGVALVQEAIKLRSNGITAPILVFYGAHAGDTGLFTDYDLIMTISSSRQAEKIRSEFAGGRRIPYHLKVDTGMGRVGVPFTEAVEIAEAIGGMDCLELRGVYSHLATSEGSDDRYLDLQLDRFEGVIGKIRKRGIDPGILHIANSGAIIRRKNSHYDMVRPGIMLYGSTPSPSLSGQIVLKEAMRWRSIVSMVKEVPEGAGISYGRKYITRKRTNIATIPVGYADGYSRLLSNNADVLIHGERYPVVGTVCMDQIMADVGGDSGIVEGDEVVLLGSYGNETVTGWELAGKAGTIPYELYCSVSPRVPRNFLNSRRPADDHP